MDIIVIAVNRDMLAQPATDRVIARRIFVAFGTRPNQAPKSRPCLNPVPIAVPPSGVLVAPRRRAAIGRSGCAANSRRPFRCHCTSPDNAASADR
jgi:hypothetical protein